MKLVLSLYFASGLGMVAFSIGLLTGGYLFFWNNASSPWQPNTLFLPNIAVWAAAATLLLMTWNSKRRGAEGLSHWVGGIMPVAYICGILTAWCI